MKRVFVFIAFLFVFVGFVVSQPTGRFSKVYVDENLTLDDTLYIDDYTIYKNNSSDLLIFEKGNNSFYIYVDDIYSSIGTNGNYIQFDLDGVLFFNSSGSYRFDGEFWRSGTDTTATIKDLRDLQTDTSNFAHNVDSAKDNFSIVDTGFVNNIYGNSIEILADDILQNYLRLQPSTSSEFGYANGVDETRIRLGGSTTGIEVTDENNSRGFVYAADYSSGAGDRWIPDKAYVDNIGVDSVSLRDLLNGYAEIIIDTFPENPSIIFADTNSKKMVYKELLDITDSILVSSSTTAVGGGLITKKVSIPAGSLNGTTELIEAPGVDTLLSVHNITFCFIYNSAQYTGGSMYFEYTDVAGSGILKNILNTMYVNIDYSHCTQWSQRPGSFYSDPDLGMWIGPNSSLSFTGSSLSGGDGDVEIILEYTKIKVPAF